MEQTSKPALPLILLTLACLAAALGGAELSDFYTRLNRLYYAYTYPLMAVRLLVPLGLGILLFFRQRLWERAGLRARLWADGLGALCIAAYLFIVYQKLATHLFARPEAWLCLAVLLCSFIHSLASRRRGGFPS